MQAEELVNDPSREACVELTLDPLGSMSDLDAAIFAEPLRMTPADLVRLQLESSLTLDAIRAEAIRVEIAWQRDLRRWYEEGRVAVESGEPEVALLVRVLEGLRRQVLYGLGGVLTSLPGCLYVNHPNRIGDAEYKPAGLAAAVAAGFTLPPTLITNVPDDARAFLKQHGPAIFKPISVPLYLVDGKAQTVPVTEVTADEIDESLAGTMHLFQRRVDKVADVRVTVIGEQIFAVRIDSGLLDWRTDYGTHTYTPLVTPPVVERAMRAYLEHFRLVFGAFDFALTDSGEWIFIECNPSGQWAWMEPPTGLPMTAALADLLEGGLRAH
ncbi:ATP-grasp ribosomal peptide maturase [Streptomyces sp. NBC_00271]|uniref:ATP-grasp ribosomal peptide maturase n=1 Tax=Streptomyces sp. NBC_00271 TaxID=2975697 RepID=UPI002E2C914F|nr:ATP-grasp ribosomal peptide maturase [Streptomyces sp. NBC_00271]